MVKNWAQDSADTNISVYNSQDSGCIKFLNKRYEKNSTWWLVFETNVSIFEDKI